MARKAVEQGGHIQPGRCRSCRKDADLAFVGEPPDQVFRKCPSCGASDQVCGARLRNKGGKRCAAMPRANGRCVLHGGADGVGHPIVHGRRSKFLPRRLMELTEQALVDPELVSTREDIALFDALIVDRAKDLDELSQAELWREASKLYRIAAAGEPTFEDAKTGEAFARMAEVLENGMGQAQRINDILVFTEQKRKLAETEMKRLSALGQFLTAHQANLLVAGLLNIIREVVHDTDQQRELGARLAGILR